jgi:hypothetical protein
MNTVETLGKNAGQGGLANAASAGKQICVMQATLRQRVGKRANHMFLPHQLVKGSGAPLTRKDLVAHAESGLRVMG